MERIFLTEAEILRKVRAAVGDFRGLRDASPAADYIPMRLHLLANVSAADCNWSLGELGSVPEPQRQMLEASMRRLQMEYSAKVS